MQNSLEHYGFNRWPWSGPTGAIRSSSSSLIAFSVSAVTLSSLWAYALCEEMNFAGTPQEGCFQDLCDL